MADPKLPRVICDKCSPLRDASIELTPVGQHSEQLVLLRCHDEEQIVILREVVTGGPVLVWSQIKFWDRTMLSNRESYHRNELIKIVCELALINRVRRSQGDAPLQLAPSVIDPIIDLLVLFRAREEPPPKPPEPRLVDLPLRPTTTCPQCKGSSITGYRCPTCNDLGIVDADGKPAPF